MINKILKQVWNQRRMNAWIFIEIIIAGFFLWTVIDPVYVLCVSHLEDKGYEEKGRYVLNLGLFHYGLSQDIEYMVPCAIHTWIHLKFFLKNADLGLLVN